MFKIALKIFLMELSFNDHYGPKLDINSRQEAFGDIENLCIRD
jgi:hypothetical protein